MDDLKFEDNLSKYDFEKLKLLWMQMYQKMQEGNINMEDEPTSSLNVEYCPNCRDKLKRKTIDLENGEILCTYCDNAKICKISDFLGKLQNYLLDLNFVCKYFIPAVEE